MERSSARITFRHIALIVMAKGAPRRELFALFQNQESMQIDNQRRFCDRQIAVFTARKCSQTGNADELAHSVVLEELFFFHSESLSFIWELHSNRQGTPVEKHDLSLIHHRVRNKNGGS
jgi:hypothetical protein